jgi:hypothetical protein
LSYECLSVGLGDETWGVVHVGLPGAERLEIGRPGRQGFGHRRRLLPGEARALGHRFLQFAEVSLELRILRSGALDVRGPEDLGHAVGLGLVRQFSGPDEAGQAPLELASSSIDPPKASPSFARAPSSVGILSTRPGLIAAKSMPGLAARTAATACSRTALDTRAASTRPDGVEILLLLNDDDRHSGPPLQTTPSGFNGGQGPPSGLPPTVIPNEVMLPSTANRLGSTVMSMDGRPPRARLAETVALDAVSRIDGMSVSSSCWLWLLATTASPPTVIRVAGVRPPPVTVLPDTIALTQQPVTDQDPIDRPLRRHRNLLALPRTLRP